MLGKPRDIDFSEAGLVVETPQVKQMVGAV
jgi:hypothetical protein